MGGNAWPVPHSLLGYFRINLKGLLALLFVGIRMVVGIIGMRGVGGESAGENVLFQRATPGRDASKSGGEGLSNRGSQMGGIQMLVWSSVFGAS